MRRHISKRGWFRTRSKHNAGKVKLDGHTFDSQREAERYAELKTFEKAGMIRGLKLQPKFPCHVKGTRVTTYTADFEYEEEHDGTWARVYEDVKSPSTVRNEAYRLRRRLVAVLYPDADIREVY